MKNSESHNGSDNKFVFFEKTPPSVMERNMRNWVDKLIDSALERSGRKRLLKLVLVFCFHFCLFLFLFLLYLFFRLLGRLYLSCCRFDLSLFGLSLLDLSLNNSLFIFLFGRFFLGQVFFLLDKFCFVFVLLSFFCFRNNGVSVFIDFIHFLFVS